MYICAEYLKMPHMEFKKLPLTERLKWLIWVEEESKQRKKELEATKERAEMQRLKAQAKKTQNPGVRRR